MWLLCLPLGAYKKEKKIKRGKGKEN